MKKVSVMGIDKRVKLLKYENYRISIYLNFLVEFIIERVCFNYIKSLFYDCGVFYELKYFLFL